MQDRKLCPTCGQRAVAINYHRAGKIHYRRQCDPCSRNKSQAVAAVPGWFLSGYRKKPHCERCGFKSKIVDQLGVFYIDGNLKNNNWSNLKTVCLNCQQEIFKTNLPWRRGGLVPDF